MKAVCQWQGAVWWPVVSDKKTLFIGQSNDTGLMIGCWCQAFKSGYRNFVMTKVDGGLRQVLDTWQCVTLMCQALCDTWQVQGLDTSHSPFLFVLTKMFTHLADHNVLVPDENSLFLMYTNKMIKRSINVPHQFKTCHFQRHSCSWS